MLLLGEKKQHQVPLNEYRQNLHQIFQRLLEQTHAKIIFALTTPVNQDWQQNPDTYGRIVRQNQDPGIYNAVAKEVANRYNIQVHDLYSIITQEGIDQVMSRDGVHFTETGYELLGQTIAENIEKNLFGNKKNSHSRPSTIQHVSDLKQLFIDKRMIHTFSGVQMNMNPPVSIQPIDLPPLNGMQLSGYSTVLQVDGSYWLYYLTQPTGKTGKKSKRMLCLSTSTDGVHWQHVKSNQFSVAGSKQNNVVMPGVIGTVFLDPNETDGCRFWAVGTIRYPELEPVWQEARGTVYGWDQSRQYKTGAIYLFKSKDGIHWNRIKDGVVLPFWCDTQNQAFYDSRRREYVAYVRGNDVGNPRKRFVARASTPSLKQLPFSYKKLSPERMAELYSYRDYITGPQGFYDHLLPGLTTPVIQADDQDPPATDIYTPAVTLYPWAQDVYFSFPAVYRHYPGPSDQPAAKNRRDDRGLYKNHGPLEIQMAVSRDGIHFHRFREPYVAPGLMETEQLGGTVYMGVGLVKHRHYIYHYYAETPVLHGSPEKHAFRFYLAKQRLDGFVSVDAGPDTGTFTTEPLIFKGDRLQLNIDCGAMGETWVEIQNQDFEAINGFRIKESTSVDRNGTAQEVWWNHGPDVSKLAGQPVRLHFKMRSSKLYGFQFIQS
jgi:hypothetical protein